jgi:sterol desaturase/sphingolipid hydroxylase (fatty acid hydroxylase superfamily)
LAQATVGFIALDFLSYWIHRAYHRFPTLWAFHIVHHSTEQLDWLSTLRLHPVSQLIDTAATTTLLLLAGMSVKALAIANAFITLSAVLAHANVTWSFGPLRHILVSPLFHQWHHARPECGIASPPSANFGAALSIWDRLFGTWSLPANSRPLSFGTEDAPGSSFVALMLHPLRVLCRALRRHE